MSDSKVSVGSLPMDGTGSTVRVDSSSSLAAGSGTIEVWGGKLSIIPDGIGGNESVRDVNGLGDIELAMNVEGRDGIDGSPTGDVLGGSTEGAVGEASDSPNTTRNATQFLTSVDM